MVELIQQRRWFQIESKDLNTKNRDSGKTKLICVSSNTGKYHNLWHMVLRYFQRETDDQQG